MTEQRQPLSYYLGLAYPYTVIADDGAYFIEFPDLPNCMTQVEDGNEIADAAEEIRTLWIETEYERGASIPEPATETDYSGKFIVRVPKSLHRDLTLSARRENVSLNAYVTHLLSERNLAFRVAARLDSLENHISTLSESSSYDINIGGAKTAAATAAKPGLKVVWKKSIAA